ncbi:helix-turn-helix transcriptional regulator [Fusibacter sp. Q10-2]|uniref:Helix-turn-helix transcriptional regulator n=2 Tax=Fusibacter ferrireducens TaxID=2785058 RepID=A0ABR9ZW49_9FIRM|nr:helix-turn-helix transcriptional regulator [Fusibacter ferrireducens]
MVLKIISEEDVYGYELIKKLELYSEQYFSLKEGSLYPILYRLEDKKMLESYQKSFEGERRVPRKYYHITQVGIAWLEKATEEWFFFQSKVETILKR